jgi:hypothetical protein
MPDQDFEIWLSGETKILIFRRTERGRYTSFAVVLMHLHDGGWTDVARFDSAHGIPHQDVLGHKSGLIQKIWYDTLTPKQAFKLAIKNFQENHETIIVQYLQN